jgi:hypothetical protein
VFGDFGLGLQRAPPTVLRESTACCVCDSQFNICKPETGPVIALHECDSRKRLVCITSCHLVGEACRAYTCLAAQQTFGPPFRVCPLGRPPVPGFFPRGAAALAASALECTAVESGRASDSKNLAKYLPVGREELAQLPAHPPWRSSHGIHATRVTPRE